MIEGSDGSEQKTMTMGLTSKPVSGYFENIILGPLKGYHGSLRVSGYQSPETQVLVGSSNLV